MSTTTVDPTYRSAPVPVVQPRQERLRRPAHGLLLLFLLVSVVQFAFGIWMNAQGFLGVDALSRAASALQVLYSTDPHLEAIGFVWMPLPTLLQLPWVAFYPLWPQVVSSGFASTITTALLGGANATLLLAVSRRFGFTERAGWAYALVISANPMLFWYASNGMSEGVAAPFLTGSVALLTLFWHSGHRRYVMAAGLVLALGFAALYQAIIHAAVLFVALFLALFLSPESDESAPRGRWWAAQALGLLLLLPSVYVGAVWVSANAAIMKDPLYFATSQYSNAAHVAVAGESRLTAGLEGELASALIFISERTVLFLIPASFLFLVRVLDRRFWRINTFSFLLLLLGVPFAFNMPFILGGTSFGWLRYFMYPLFVTAGWGLYEIRLSNHPSRARNLVLAGWVLAVPVTLWAMSNPALGREEHKAMRGVASGQNAEEVGYYSFIDETRPISLYLEKEVLSNRQTLAMDAFAAWPIVVQTSPDHLASRVILTSHRKFNEIILTPDEHGVSYFLVPNPRLVPSDAIVRAYPGLWAGGEPGFELVRGFPETFWEWRLYRVAP